MASKSVIIREIFIVSLRDIDKGIVKYNKELGLYFE